MKMLSNRKYNYHVFGLNMESAIPFLDMPMNQGKPDVTIRFGTVPAKLSNAKITGVRYQAGPGEFLLQVDNVARYYVVDGNCVVIERQPGVPDEEVLLFLMGSAMGALLHQRNILPLHGSAIAVDGEGIIFIGPSGVGKSTLAAGFQKRFHLFSDDVCAVIAAAWNEHPMIIPGFPRLKLWADALHKLQEETEGLNRVRPRENFEKFFLPFYRTGNGSIPIRSVFVFAATNTDEFQIVELKGREKIYPLMYNTFRPRFLEGLGGKDVKFRQCAAIADKAKVFSVGRPKKGFRLNELMDLVERNW